MLVCQVPQTITVIHAEIIQGRQTASLVQWERRTPPERHTWVRFLLLSWGFCPGRVAPVTSTLVLQWLPCQASGGAGSALGLVGPVSVVVVGCLTSQQHASVSHGRICSDNCTCCHTEIEVADPTFHLTQSQYTDTGPTSPSADPITPGAWQGSHWSANFEVTGMTRPRKNPCANGIRSRDLPLSRRTPYH